MRIWCNLRVVRCGLQRFQTLWAGHCIAAMWNNEEFYA
jgi:hypothetical protein